MMNLLQETIEVMNEHGKAPEDVRWVGGDTFWFTWDEFSELADRDYDNGFGGQEVARDLVVVGGGWHMERHEYDGSEWWEFKQQLPRPEEHKVPRSLFAGIGCERLAVIDQERAR